MMLVCLECKKCFIMRKQQQPYFICKDHKGLKSEGEK